MSKLSGRRNAKVSYIPYFPVYKRPFFGLNFYFKNRGSLIHGCTGVFHLMYPPLMYHGILTGNRCLLMYHSTLIGAKVLFCLIVY